MKNQLTNNFTGLKDSVKDYLNIQVDLAKLSLLEKMTKISVSLTVILTFILAGSIMFLFSAAAFVVWYGNQYQDYVTGLLIVMGVVFLMTLVFYFSRTSIISSFFLKTFSKIIIDDDEDDD